MIIHEEMGRKKIVEKAITARMSLDGQLFIAYKSTTTGARGIVEFNQEETILILAAKRGDSKGQILGGLSG